MVKKNICFILVILFAVFSARALLHPGLPPTHDGEYHIVRFYEFDKALRDGNWYPRWSKDLNFGYGVPLFNFVYPFPNYVSFFLHLLGISFIDSFKINMVFASLVTGVAMYLWAKEFWGNSGALVASIVYLFSPYRFLDIFIRGSVGEIWALAFFPAYFWSITRYFKTKNLLFLLCSSLFLSLIIFSHNILAFIFFPVAISYSLFLMWRMKQKMFTHILLAFLLGVGTASLFWLPALIEKKYTVGLELWGVANHFPELYQLLIPSWGSGFSGIDDANQMSFQIGVVNILAIGVACAALFKKKSSAIILFFLLLFFVTFFLMLQSSHLIWDIIPFMNYLQFPWRLLSLEILFSSFLAGSFVVFFKQNRYTYLIGVILVFFACLFTYSYTTPAYYHMRDDRYYIKRSNFIDGTNSPGDAFNTKWAHGITKHKPLIELSKGGKIHIEESKTSYRSATVETSISQTAHISIGYFPGWTVLGDGKEIVHTISKDGGIEIPVPAGKHMIEILFKDSPIRLIATVTSGISVASILLIGFHTIIMNKRKKDE